MKKKEQAKHNDVVFEDEEQSAGKSTRDLKEKLSKCLSERKEYLDGWQRAKADYVNAKRQFDSERAEMVKYGKVRIICDLMPVLDAFEMAFSNKEAWEKVDQNWRSGVEFIHRDFTRILEEHGLSAFNPKGELFDPSRHESVREVPVKDKEDDQRVVETLKLGYEWGGKVIRPASVAVGKFGKSN